MERKILLPLFCLFLAFSALSQTNVSGNISSNTTWTKANSPYTLTGDISLTSNSVLTIEPGVLVQSNGAHQLKVNRGARLIADGTANDSIRFEVPAQTEYMILFSGASTGQSSFDYVSVQGNGMNNHENLFIETIQAAGNNNAKLTISNALIDNVSMKIGASGGRVALSKDQINRSYLWSDYNGTGFDIEDSHLVYTALTQQYLSSINNVTAAKTVISNSKFINTPVYLPHSVVEMTGSQFMIDDNTIERTPGLRANSILIVSELLMSNSLVDAGKMPAIVLFNTFGGGYNRIENNVFVNVSQLLNVQQHQSTLFNANDIYAPESSQLFVLVSRADVDGRGNHIYGITELSRLQELVFSANSAKIDLTGAEAEPINTDMLVSPSPIIRRLFESDDYTDKVELDWSVNQITTFDHYRVFRFGDNVNFQFIGEYAPDDKPQFDIGTENRYFVEGRKNSGEISAKARALNAPPQIIVPPSNTRIADQRAEYNIPVKVLDRENDFVKLNMTDFSGSDIIAVKSFDLTMTGSSGDTLIYNLNVVPEPDQFGQFFKIISSEDGLNADQHGVGFWVVRLPEVTEVRNIEGLSEGFEYSVNQFDLEKHLDWVAEPFKNVKIKITKLLNGTLTYDGEAIESIDELPDYSGRFPELIWRAPLQVGVVDAFEIKLFDDENESVESTTIKFDLTPNQAPVLTQIEQVDDVREDTRKGLGFNDLMRGVTVTDADNHDISLVITELLNGRVTRGYFEDEDQDLPYEFSTSNNYIFWHPPANEFGIIEGFKVRAYDGSKLSDEELIVKFNVSSVNDLPSFDFIETPPAMIGATEIQSLSITGVNEGPLEDQDLHFFITGAQDGDIMPQNRMEIIYEQGSDNALLRYLPLEGAQGTENITVNLSDGQNTYQQKIAFNFVDQNHAPEIITEASVKAYVGYPFVLDYQISDNRPFITSEATSTSGWLQIDNGNRIVSLTERRRQYNSPTRDGILSHAIPSVGWAMVKDNDGNVWYSEGREIKMITPNGVIKTVAGNGAPGLEDGRGTEARFSGVYSLAYDKNADVIYAIDNKAIRKIDREFNVTTVFIADDDDVYGNFGPADVDSEGNLYFVNSYYYGNETKIHKLTPSGIISDFAGSGDNSNSSFTGLKEDIAIYEVDGLKVVNDEVYFISNSLFRKIDKDGNVTQITLADGLSDQGYDSYLAKYGDDLLVYQSRVGKIVRVDVSDYSIEYVTGLGDKGFQENMPALEFIAGVNNGSHIYGMVEYEGKGLMLSLEDAGGTFFGLIHKRLDSIQGTPEASDLGMHQVEITTEDIDGLTTTKTVNIEVLLNNKITATNLEQDISFEEDSPFVDLDDIVLSGLESNQSANVSVVLNKRWAGSLTADSGNQETYVDSTGTWSVSGSQTEVNDALAALRFIPASNYDREAMLAVRIINTDGGVPNLGEVKLNFLEVLDQPSLTESFEDSAFVAVEYLFEPEVQDPDSKLYNFEMGELPAWLSYEEGPLWVQNYTGDMNSSRQTIDGDLNAARFNQPRAIRSDGKGALYVVDQYHVRKISPDEQVSTVFSAVGGRVDGPLSDARFDYISAFDIASDGTIYVADSRTIRKISTDDIVSTIAGTGNSGYLDGEALEATFDYISGLRIDSKGNLYVLDNLKVRKLGTDGKVTTVAGNGAYGYGTGNALEVPFLSLKALDVDAGDNLIIGDDRSIRKLDVVSGEISAIAGIGEDRCCTFNVPNSEVQFRDLKGLDIGDDNKIYAILENSYFVVDLESGFTSSTYTYNYPGVDEGPLSQIRFNSLTGIVKVGHNVFLSDRSFNNIRRIYTSPGEVSGTPTAEELGKHEVSYSVFNNKGEEKTVVAEVEVFNNDRPDFSTLNTVYSYTEDEILKVTDFQLSGDDDQFIIELSLKDDEIGTLTLNGFEDLYDPETGTWTVTGSKPEVNEILASIEYLPIPNNHDNNQVLIRAQLTEGRFDVKGVLVLNGISVDDLPEFVSLADQTTVVDAQIELKIGTSDGDNHPLMMNSDNLPDWLTLERRIVSEVSTVAGGSQYLPDGKKDEVVINDPRGLTKDDYNNLYFLDRGNVRMLTKDSVKTLTAEPLRYPVDARHLLLKGDSLYVIARNGIHWLKSRDEFVLKVGGEEGDTDGDASVARFTGLLSSIIGPDGKSFYVADYEGNKVKLVEDDFSVSTLAGPEEQNEPGADPATRTISPYEFSRSPNGKYYLLDVAGRFIYELEPDGSLVTPQYPEASEWEEVNSLNGIRHIETDIFGNHFFSFGTIIYILEPDGSFAHIAGDGKSGLEDGPGLESSLGYISDMLLEDDGEMLLGDYYNGRIRKFSYQFDYYLTGKAPEDSQGEYTINLTVDDGFSDTSVDGSFKLKVEDSDRPSVEGLTQSVIYTEDTPRVDFEPIAIQTTDEQTEFEVILNLSSLYTGTLASDALDMENVRNEKQYKIAGTASELKSILETLYFIPTKDNVAPSAIEISVKQLSGILETAGVFDLTVTPVNDPPVLKAVTQDTLAVVGQKMIVEVDYYDVDGSLSFTDNTQIPEWLTLQSLSLKSELFAGTPETEGLENGPALKSKFTAPTTLAADSLGQIYVLEDETNLIRVISPEGEVSLFTGSGITGFRDGPADQARFNDPQGFVLDGDGNMYVSDSRNYVIRKVDPSGSVETFAGSGNPGFENGVGEMASFGELGQITLDRQQGQLYVLDITNKKIRIVDIETREVSDLHMSSYYSQFLYKPMDIEMGPDRSLYYMGEHSLLKINLENGYPEFVNNPWGEYNDGAVREQKIHSTRMAIDRLGNIVLNDIGGKKLRLIRHNTISSPHVNDEYGYQEGYAEQIKVQGISDLLFLPDGSLLTSESTARVIRKFELNPYALVGTPDINNVGQTVANLQISDTENATAELQIKIDVVDRQPLNVYGLNSATIFTGDQSSVDLPPFIILNGAEGQIEVVIEKISGQGQLGLSEDDLLDFDESIKGWKAIASRDSLNILFHRLRFFPSQGAESDFLTEVTVTKLSDQYFQKGSLSFIYNAENLAPAYVGSKQFEVAVGEDFQLVLNAIDPNGDSTAFFVESSPDWLKGDSVWVVQEFYNPIFSPNMPPSLREQLAINPAGLLLDKDQSIIFSDAEKPRIDRLSSGFEKTTIAGIGYPGDQDGPLDQARFYSPGSIAFDADSNLLVLDKVSNKIKRIGDGFVTTISGNGGFAGDGIGSNIGYGALAGISMDSVGNYMIADENSIRKLHPNTLVTTYAGSNDNPGSIDGDRSIATIDSPVKVIHDTEGNLFFAEPSRIRKINREGEIITITGSDTFGYADGDFETAQFAEISDMIELEKGVLLISDFGNHVIRKVDLNEGTVSTIAGTGARGNVYGEGSQARFNNPFKLLKTADNEVIVFDSRNGTLKKLSYSVPVLSGKAQESDLGEHTLVFRISDGKGAIIEEEITINVIQANTAPSATTIDDITETYVVDGTITIPLFDYFSDAEDADNELSYEVVSNTDNTVVTSEAVDSADGLLTLNIENAGITELEVKVTDSRSASVSSSFQIEISKAAASVTITSEETVADGGEKSVNVTTDPVDLTVLVTYNNQSDLPTEAGTYEVVATVDERNYEGEATYEFVIIPANTVPTVTTIDNITETYSVDGTITIPLFDYFSDAEDADSELAYEVVSNTDNTVVTPDAVDSSDGILNLNIENAGTTTLEVKVTDSRGASVSTTFAVTVDKAAATISITDTEFVNDGEAKSVTVATDPNGLAFTITYDGSETAPSAIGVYEVIVNLEERNYAGTATAQLSIINVAPEDLNLSGLTVFENQEGSTSIGTLTVTDQNPGDTHSYSLPAGINDNDLFALSGTNLSASEPFDFETKDEYTVTVKVEDNQGSSYEEAFTITILDVNDAPGATMPDPIETVKDLGPLAFNVSGLTTGGEVSQTLNLSTTVSGVLANASVVVDANGTSATITFESLSGQEGSGIIQLTMKDDGGTANEGVDTYVLDIPVTVSPANLILTGASNCGPGQLTLSASGADAYSWYAGALAGEALATGADFTTNLATTTTFFVAGTFSGSESSLRVPVQASIFNQPEVPVIVNNAEILSVTEAVGASYTWFRNGTELPDVSGASFAPTDSGDYTVMITNANGCTAMSDALSVIITGLEEGLPEIDVTVYPVPSSDYIHLSFTEVMRKGTQIRLLDNSGRELTSQIMQVAGTKARIDVRSFASGIHFITVQDQGKMVRKRVIIKK